MSETLGRVLGSPVSQALIILGMAALYARFLWEYRRENRRRLEDPKWKNHYRLLSAWRWKMRAFAAGGALVFAVIAIDVLGLIKTGALDYFKWAFGVVFVWGGLAAFVQGYLEGPGGNPNDAA